MNLLKDTGSIILVILCLFCFTACSWSKADIIKQTAITGVMAIDYQQTKRNAGNYKEQNIFLGEFPSNKSIDIYFLSCGILANSIPYVIHKEKIKWFLQAFIFGMEVKVDLHNSNLK